MSHRGAPLLPSLLLVLLLLLPASYPERLEARRLELHERKPGGQHDASFDQELLLGNEGAQQLKGMRRQQATRKLAELFDSLIDADKDGVASKQELVSWLAKVADKQMQAETDSQWAALNATERLGWRQFAVGELPDTMSKRLRAAFAEQLLKVELPTVASGMATSDEESAAAKEYVAEIAKKRRRWLAADTDKDGLLTKQEFRRLLFAEEYPETREVVVDEELQRLDTDGDGKISLAEFLVDVWSPTKGNEEKEPEWVQHERADFRDKKDKDKDGFLDRKEIAAYLFDGDEKEDLYRREAEHLLREADTDKDGRLGRKEMLDNLDLLAGSAATNYGDHLGIREEL